MLLADIHDHTHVRKFGSWLDLEPAMNFFKRHSRRKRTKCLTHLDHRIDTITHLRMARIGQNTAMPQRAWPEFHSPAIPSDHSARRNQPRRFDTSVLKRPEAHDFDAVRKLLQCIVNLGHRIRRAIKRNWRSAIDHFARLPRAI